LGGQLYQYKINIAKGIASSHPCTIFILYGALLLAQKTAAACLIILVVNSAGLRIFSLKKIK
jgi:hypothetical protein